MLKFEDFLNQFDLEDPEQCRKMLRQYEEYVDKVWEEFGKRWTWCGGCHKTVRFDQRTTSEELVGDKMKLVTRCPVCGNLSENNNLCEICSSDERDHNSICVVCSPKDVFSFEKMKEYHGVYHVLNGYISPSKGIGYDDINLPSLIQRIKENNIEEKIIDLIKKERLVHPDTMGAYNAALVNYKKMVYYICGQL